jgi:hypothetical protein
MIQGYNRNINWNINQISKLLHRKKNVVYLKIEVLVYKQFNIIMNEEEEEKRLIIPSP